LKRRLRSQSKRKFVPQDIKDEKKVSTGLISNCNFSDEETLKRQRNRKYKRYALVGLATLGGGALLGLTGGLAAPLIGKNFKNHIFPYHTPV
jgi:hypothetical protein